MLKQSFIKELFNRRIPQIIGSYIVAGTSLVLFIDWLVNRYAFPQYYVTLALVSILSISQININVPLINNLNLKIILE